MTEKLSVCKELQRLLRKGKLEKSHNWVSHLVRFSVDDGEVEFVTCLENQVELAFNFLREKNADFILIEELGKITMTYNLGLTIESND